MTATSPYSSTGLITGSAPAISASSEAVTVDPSAMASGQDGAAASTQATAPLSTDGATATAARSDVGTPVPGSAGSGAGGVAVAMTGLSFAGDGCGAEVAFSDAVEDAPPCRSAASPDSPPGQSKPHASTVMAAAPATRRLRRRGRARSAVPPSVPLLPASLPGTAVDGDDRRRSPFDSTRATRRSPSLAPTCTAVRASPTRPCLSALLARRESAVGVPAAPRRPSAWRSFGRAFAARATSRARSGVSTSHRRGRGAAICSSAASHSSI